MIRSGENQARRHIWRSHGWGQCALRVECRKTCRAGNSRQRKNGRQHKDDSTDEAMRFRVTARHTAFDKIATAMMIARHRSLLRTTGRMALLRIVAMHRAHSASTAAHFHALPGCRPGGAQSSTTATRHTHAAIVLPGAIGNWSEPLMRSRLNFTPATHLSPRGVCLFLVTLQEQNLSYRKDSLSDYQTDSRKNGL